MSAKYCLFKMAHALPTPIMAAFDWYCEEGGCAVWREDEKRCSFQKGPAAASTREATAEERRHQAYMDPELVP